jgi:AbrB family looped-hinge helix DNA binding protein
MEMADTSTVTSKSMINFPARLRRKYGIRTGSKVAFVETEAGLLLVPLLSVKQMFGIDSEHHKEIIEGIRELHRMRREEARKE